RRAGGDLDVDSFVGSVESLSSLDLGIGTTLRFAPDRHQGSDRVWGTVLDASATYRVLDLTP
ncbi:MAG: ABC transporter substrate-binding protein, partial [Acidobacteriota bacterium]